VVLSYVLCYLAENLSSKWVILKLGFDKIDLQYSFTKLGAWGVGQEKKLKPI
jgi:hypothetical protein